MNEITIAAVTPTICQVMGMACGDGAPVMGEVIEAAKTAGSGPVQKVFLYAPDAIGSHAFRAHRPDFEAVLQEAPLQVAMKSVFPSVTPVCFASMFTGLRPAEHGISRYEKPVLKVRTLFDRLIDAGKKAAIVAVRGSSIATIFRERQMDYFAEEYDAEVTQRTLELLDANEHDSILAYHQEYDDTIHQKTPQSEEALAAMRRHIGSFVRLAKQFHHSCSDRKRLVGFVPDHGVHVDAETGKGTHGLNIPEDMDLQHFYGVFAAGKD